MLWQKFLSISCCRTQETCRLSKNRESVNNHELNPYFKNFYYPDAAQTLKFDRPILNKLFARTLRTPGSSKVELIFFWYFLGEICYHQSCSQTQITLCKSDFTPVTSIDKFATKETIILDDILVCFWTVVLQKLPAILNSSWLDSFTIRMFNL